MGFEEGDISAAKVCAILQNTVLQKSIVKKKSLISLVLTVLTQVRKY
jgi:hypothetical protein